MSDHFALIAAAALGPFIAVLTAFWLFYWERAYQRRLDIFRSLMRMRRQWLSQEWIGALNLVPVEFHRFPVVLDAYNKLLDRYADPAWKGSAPERQRAALDCDSSACELLQRMAAAMKIELRGPDLRTRLISPYGWKTDELQQRQSRDLALEILQGDRPLRIELVAPDQR